MTVRIPREPLDRRARLALTLAPEHLGVALLVTCTVGVLTGAVLLATGTVLTGALMLAAGLAAGALLAVGTVAERDHTVEIPVTAGLAVHVGNGVQAWRALPRLLQAETLPVLRGLYDAGVVASREPYDAALRKRVVDRVLLLQRVGEAHRRTDEVARRQAVTLARGELDDSDLDEGAYTLTVLREGLRALGADDEETLRRFDGQRAAAKRASGFERHARYHGDGLARCEHCDAR